MSDLLQILLTSLLTVFSGSLVFAISQIVSKFVIEPVCLQRQVIRDIDDALVFYANVYVNPGGVDEVMTNAAYKKLRELSSLLSSRTNFIFSYRFFEKIRLVLPENNVKQAARCLIGLSNSVFESSSGEGIKNSDRADEIRGLLKIQC